MSELTSADWTAFLRKQYALWNEGKRTELFALFRAMAPNAFTVEYVGHPVQDGWKALEEIWDEHAGSTRIEVLEILANGHEVAVYAHNHHLRGDGHLHTRPSIELYEFGAGTLRARYFYPA
jgi:hypothetical protein